MHIPNILPFFQSGFHCQQMSLLLVNVHNTMILYYAVHQGTTGHMPQCCETTKVTHCIV